MTKFAFGVARGFSLLAGGNQRGHGFGIGNGAAGFIRNGAADGGRVHLGNEAQAVNRSRKREVRTTEYDTVKLLLEAKVALACANFTVDAQELNVARPRHA